MAFNKVEPDYYNERKHVVEQLKRFNDPFEFSKVLSLATLEAAVENIRIKEAAYNAAIDVVEAARIARLLAIEEEKPIAQAMRTCLAGVKGKNSDEFVAAGGKRKSDIEAAQQKGREYKKKTAEDAAKKAADDAAQKVVDAAVEKALNEVAKKTADKPA